MRDIGLAGVPFSGKSTLFAALTRHGAVGGRANQAVVQVPDPRLEVLARIEGSQKAVSAQVRFIDVPGGTGSAQGVAALREVDALCAVIRCFGNDARPAEELATLRAELLLADLEVVGSALGKAEKRGHGKATEEVVSLRRAHDTLSAEKPLRDADLEPQDGVHLRPLAPLTAKPMVVVANLEEGTDVPSELADATGVYAEIEAETLGMPEEEARALLREFGVAEPGLEKVIAACYRALDLITFFTANEQEAHAWEAPRGATAPEAAGAIHTDFERGFIRAEVVGFDELAGCGGWDEARHRGLIRVEGKGYRVQEGDVLHVRFAV
jgi:hypothetical protein